MAVALLALVVALGGTATAASVLIRRSSQVATGAINSGDLADDRGVSLRDLTPDTRRAITAAGGGPPGAEGPRGAQGPVGAKGESGPRGPRGEALAFAHVPAEVPANGLPTEGTSKGVIEVRQVPNDNWRVYCFDLAVPAVNAVATVDFGSAVETGILVRDVFVAMPSTDAGLATITEDCPAGLRDGAAYFYDPDDPQIGIDFFIVFN
jgi:hypothetical protein